MPVSLWNRATSSRSRLWLEPTALSPMNVIFWPLYFFLSAAAPATFGGFMAAAAVPPPAVLLAPPAVATLSETSRASAPATPTRASTPRCFTVPLPFYTCNAAPEHGGRDAAPVPSAVLYHCGDCPVKGLRRREGAWSWPPPERVLAVRRLRRGRRRRREVGRVRVRVVAVRVPSGARSRCGGRRRGRRRAPFDERVRRRSVADGVDERAVRVPQADAAARGREAERERLVGGRGSRVAA